MSNRMKEEERIERIIRNLLKLPENRRCINCNSLGPQYVCTTFWTFVCTTCSGVHREFTHRVKSVSMAKFNAEEVSALQAGGNERAKQIYFKEWDLQLHSFPDASNKNRLWDFIKHVYVDRKFTGYRCEGKLAMGAKEDFSDQCSFERPSTGGRIENINSKYYIQERKSPLNKPDTIRPVNKNRPVYFEVVDDRFRDGGFQSGRRNETPRSSTAESRTRSGSPVPQISGGKISPPVVRPVSELLGANVPRLQVGGSPNERKDADSSDHGKKSASPSGPVEFNSLEPETVKSVSLIDFSPGPEPPAPAAAPQALQTTLSIEGGNGASDLSSANSVDTIFGLSAPAAGPVDIMSEAPVYIDDGQKLPVAPQNHLYLLPPDDSNSTSPITTPSVGALHNQSWIPSSVHNARASSSESAEKSSQSSSEVTQDGMKELPADLFTSSYSSFPAPAPDWQVRPLHGMGFHMQYYSTAMPLPAFPNSAKSRNPFDTSNDGTEAEVPMFPSMLPVQESLPNLPACSALLHTSDPHSPHLMQPQASPYGSIAASQLPYGMSLTPVSGAFQEQQSHSGLPLSRSSKINTSKDAFASLNPIRQPSSIYPARTTTNSFSSSGQNPFG